MTADPATAAAQRAIENMPALITHPNPIVSALFLDVGAAAAREFAAPLRKLHRPGTPVYTHGRGADFEDLCPDCRGKAGIHECGCWGDYDRDIYCATCRDEKGRHAPWPCATAKLIYPEDEL